MVRWLQPPSPPVAAVSHRQAHPTCLFIETVWQPPPREIAWPSGGRILFPSGEENAHSKPVKFASSLLILLSVFSIPARAGVSGHLTYTENPTSITIDRCYPYAQGELTVPATINGKPVTEFKAEAFSQCGLLTTVDIKSPVTTIGYGMFATCWSMRKIKLPPTVTRIEESAFFYCEKLTDITIPDKVTFIGLMAFGNTALKNVVLPSGLKTLEDRAFSTCPSLRKVTFLGKAPVTGDNLFEQSTRDLVVFFHEGKNGFTTPEWKGAVCRKLSPEIAIYEPKKTSLTDGTATKDFGRAKAGSLGGNKTFIISNNGNLALDRINVSLTGKQARNFILTPPSQTTIEPGGAARFTISFKPRATGTQRAVVRIKSTDMDESSFEINLTGIGTAK